MTIIKPSLSRLAYKEADPKFCYSPVKRTVGGKQACGVTETTGKVTFYLPSEPDFATWFREAYRTVQFREAGFWPGCPKAGQGFSPRFLKTIDKQADEFMAEMGFEKVRR